ncbi:hypothetical protein [Domibacillus indicus]|uniref:hypothetical protein n=1 Tax=Domibacillus indicus TaxID=1437523 RepID=UPI000618115D|nr:hypothetical protein [Domibacillus indicus]
MPFYPPNRGREPFRPYPGPKPFDPFFGPFPPNPGPPYQNSRPVYQNRGPVSWGPAQQPPQKPGVLARFLQNMAQQPPQGAAIPPQAPAAGENTGQLPSQEKAAVPPQGGAANPLPTQEAAGTWGNISQMLAHAEELSRGIHTLKQIGSVFMKK